MLHSSPDSSPPRSRWRIVRRVSLALAILIVLLIVAAQIVFWTNIPRNLVKYLLEKQYGLRIDARTLSTGFFGHSTLDDVTVALPLSDQPALSVPHLELDHTWIIALLFGEDFTVNSIDITQPNLDIRQDATGAWNIEQALALIAQYQKPSQNNGTTPLLFLKIHNATLNFTDAQNRSTKIENVSFTGTPQGALVWQVAADVPGHLKATGKFAPGDRWAHVIDFELDDFHQLLAPWIPDWPASANIQAQWTGQISSGNLQGQLNVEKSGYESISADGPIDIATDSDGIVFTPRGVTIHDATNSGLNAQLIAGDIAITVPTVKARGLALQFNRGRGTLDAEYQFAQRSATVHATWNDLVYPGAINHSGDLQFAFSAEHGSPNFNGTLQCRGQGPSGSWDSVLDLTGHGDTPQTVAATLIARKFVLKSPSGKSLDLSGLTTDFQSNADGVVLRDIQLGASHPLAGRGGIVYSKQIAWLSLDGREWPVPSAPGQMADVDLDFWATPERLHLDQFYLSVGHLSAYLNGDYVVNEPKPVKAHLYLTDNPQSATMPATPPPFGGNLQGQFDLNGTINPLDIALTGSASGQGLYYRQRSFGDLDLEIAGFLRDNQITIASRNIQLLGGTWTINGHWPVQNSLFRIDNLSVQNLSLPLATGNPNIAGTLDGKWSVDVRDLTPEGISIDGSASIHDLNINANPNLVFDQIDMPAIHIGDGWAILSRVALSRKSGSTTGNARVNLVTSLRDPNLLWINLDSHDWPYLLNPSSPSSGTPGEGWGGGSNSNAGWNGGLVSAKGKLALDLSERSLLGSLDVDVNSLWNSHSIGEVSFVVNADRRRFDFRNINVKTMDSVATGDGTFDLDAPYQSHGQLAWKNLNLQTLRPVSAAVETLTGKMAGSLQIHPSTTPRPLGPLELDLRLDSDQVSIKGMKIGNMTATAYFAPGRFVLDDSDARPSAIDFAGGSIHIWGRISRHEGDIWQALLQLNLHRLDLDALLPAGSKVARTPGVLSGQVTILGTPFDIPETYGQGSLSLEHSDLAGTGAIAFVYNLMHVLHNPNKPTGNGNIEFTIDDGNAHITNMRYFDRGSELAVNGDIGDLTKWPGSHVNLIVVGSARPLAAINLPAIGDFDAAIRALQRNAIAVRVTGPFNHTHQESILFSSIGREMYNFLFGKSSESSE